MSAPQVSIVKLPDDPKTRYLKILLPINEDPQPSTSGKTLIVATTHGNLASSVEINGSKVKVGVSAFIPNPNHGQE